MLAPLPLEVVHRQHGAVLADDGIPLHYGDLDAEYRAAHEAAIIMDRSHEGRLSLTGRDRLAIPHRISTNDLEGLIEGKGAPTVFTTPNARILDRAAVYHRGAAALLTTEPGRAGALRAYLQRNIFFNDEAQIVDLAPATRQFSLHGVTADALIASIAADLPALPAYGHHEIEIGGVPVFVGRRAALVGGAWTLIVPVEGAALAWSALARLARPAGSLCYNLLRIEAGRPGVGRELSEQFIPLEVGLWDEVSFTKGCYTGQEIIARMESRGRQARTIVTVRLNAPADAPAPLLRDGREVGTLTSSATKPDHAHIGIAVIKIAEARIGSTMHTPDGAEAAITGLPGAQPPFTAEDGATER